MARKGRVHLYAGIHRVVRNGKATFVLLCEDKFLAEFFDNWAYQLAKVSPFNTVKSYCSDVRLMIDFVLAMAHLCGGLTALVLSNALDSFENFLVFGKNSEDEPVRTIAERLHSKQVSGTTAARCIASVNSFMGASETFRLGMLEFEALGYISPSHISVFPQHIVFSTDISIKVKAALKKNSWFAGCLAGGAKKIKFKGLTPKSKPSSIANVDEFGGDDKAFPIDKLVELIESATCSRDKALWSLAGAIGPRVSELLSMFRNDIKPGRNDDPGKIFIIDPNTRMRELSQWLSAEDAGIVSHKGRSTPDTFAIEPFISHFWVSYAEYRQEVTTFERKHPFAERHEFAFGKLTTNEPLIKSYQTVYERFREAAFKVTGTYYGLHSLRHMYGYYLANFCPNPWHRGRFGLDLKMVQHYMGHQSIRTTLRYARKDARMLEATISALNSIRMGMRGFNVNNVRLQHLESLKKEIECALRGKDND